MEFYELGKIAKLKGHKEVQERYLAKAYTIAKKIALQCQTDFEATNPLKAIYLRSISWLAYDAKKYKEAYLWTSLALNIIPNIYEEASLIKLLAKLNTKIQIEDLKEK